MAPTYAVIWQELGFPTYVGKLVVGNRRLQLEGLATGARESLLRLLYGEIERVWIGRGPDERLDGLNAVVIERLAGAPLRIATVDGVGATTELASRISEHVPGGRVR